MKGTKYLSTIDSLQERNRFLGIALAVLVGLNVLNLLGLARLAARTQTIIVPLGSEGMQIGNGRADPRYVRRMARYIVNQIGSYSAGSARQQYQEVLQLFASDKVTGAAKYFDRLVADIERYPSISFNVEWAGQDPLKFTSNMIQVVGIKERYVSGSVVERKGTHYCIRYHIDEARFWIDNITEKSEAGTDLCFIDDKTAPVTVVDDSDTDEPAREPATAATSAPAEAASPASAPTNGPAP